jgi:LPS-assembly lipoprotein
MRYLVLLLLAALCTACGFHLQGNLQLAPPLHRMYLQTPDPYGHFSRDLTQYLKMSQVTLMPSSASAETTLIILQDESSQTLIGVNGTQQTRQYVLRVTVAFEITNRRGVTIVPRQELSETHTITIQSNQVLGSSNQANMYYQQMRRRLASALMNRIASIEVTNIINSSARKKP